MIWISGSPGEQFLPPEQAILCLKGAFALLLAAILGVGIYSRTLARRLTGQFFSRGTRRFNRMMWVARLAIPAWYALIVFGLNFPAVIRQFIEPMVGMAESPGFLLGTLPAMVAWVGLWWAAYPAEQALREQNLLIQMESNLPVRLGPTLTQYLIANIRLQLLFLLAPVLCILALRDVLVFGAGQFDISLGEGYQLIISLAAMLPVMLVSPFLLIRILPTEPLPASPLRDRLEELCHKNGLKVSDILLWKTGGNIGNAAVMGIMPRTRYLLVTDLLLETMPEEQLLAVFAHEIGHVVHRHLLWMGGCAVGLMFFIAGPVDSSMRLAEGYITIPEPYRTIVAFAVSGPLFLAMFGLIMRRLERQADVFAARTIPHLLMMQMVRQGDLLSPAAPMEYAPNHAFVKGHGATLVCGALKRVAIVNNIPIASHEWLHGSIASRIKYLIKISDDPQQTWQFDQFMRRLFGAILLFLLAMGAWAGWNLFMQL